MINITKKILTVSLIILIASICFASNSYHPIKNSSGTAQGINQINVDEILLNLNEKYDWTKEHLIVFYSYNSIQITDFKERLMIKSKPIFETVRYYIVPHIPNAEKYTSHDLFPVVVALIFLGLLGFFLMLGFKVFKVKKINKRFFIYITIFFSALLVFCYYPSEGKKSKPLNYKVVNFSEIQNLSYASKQYRNQLYGVEENVILHLDTTEPKYTFCITPINLEFADVQSKQFSFKGTTSDFNEYVRELKFLDKNRGVLTNNFTEAFKYNNEASKAAFKSFLGIFTSIWEMVRHPVKSAKAIAGLIKKIGVSGYDILTGELTFSEIKTTVGDFFKMFWYDLCCKTGSENDVDYPKHIYPATGNLIEEYSAAKVQGMATFEVATLLIAWAKIGKIGKISKIGKIEDLGQGAKAAGLFKYLKSAKLTKPVVEISESAVSHYKVAIRKFKNKKKLGKIAGKKGGRHGNLDCPEGHERHHMPADSTTNMRRDDGPAIAMEKDDHYKTANWGPSKEARAYRKKQKELVDQGEIKEAIQMDIDDIRSKFGDKYDDQIKEMMEYADTL